jgi:nicotinamidase-related amidase
MKGFTTSSVIDRVLDPERTAVLAMHWQRDVVAEDGAFGKVFAEAVRKDGVIERTARFLAAAREIGCSIIYINIVYRPRYEGVIVNNPLFRTAVQSEGFIQGTRGVEVISDLQPTSRDLVVEHARSSAFFGSDLLTILIGKGIDTVCLTGIATNVAVDHTARDAMQYGFKTYLVEDCCCSSDPRHHEAALVTLRVLCTGVLESAQLIESIRTSGLKG